MKKVLGFLIVFCFAATLSFAQVQPPVVNSTSDAAAADTVKAEKKAKGKKGKHPKKHHKKKPSEATGEKSAVTVNSMK